MNWKSWFHGLAAAFIGGGSSAVSAGVSGIIVAPESFNTNGGTGKVIGLMASTFVVSGLLSAFFYLKSSPLPSDDSPVGAVVPLDEIRKVKP